MWLKTMRTIVASGLTVAVFAIAGCDDEEDYAAPAAPAQAKKNGAVEKADETADEAVEEIFTYNAVDRRDPFRSYFADLNKADAEEGELSELQQIELDQFRLVGVITGTATPMAMVQDNSGKGYTVKIGTRIGKQLGQIKQIRRGEVVIQEEFRDFTGAIVPVYKTLKLVKKGS